MKNAKYAYELVPGDVVSSGEIVVAATPCFIKRTRKKVIVVTLRNKRDKIRHGTWGYYSLIFMAKGIDA